MDGRDPDVLAEGRNGARIGAGAGRLHMGPGARLDGHVRLGGRALRDGIGGWSGGRSGMQRPAREGRAAEDVTYFRLAFCGELGEQVPGAKLDKGIVRTLWMTPDEIRANVDRLRSPLVLRCMEDHLAGQRFPLDMIYTDPSVLAPAKG
jgi:hypothetical protein